ncbi:unnamed protein product [Rotaria sp. Silwood2]|nr:unnamed protein product [Rotaria sp. Silwood2]CAF3053252.1 unnamed protein product [Rotaria sp. Silwood2]CAF3232727.1 unnamed protein product [Rotaria sp. Silwood2]CAF3352628.1 unnamed protein product [Rotaria sp. Silwood2]CAF4070920.1 unnamed protein product [Rotaria sp. Silwood2]
MSLIYHLAPTSRWYSWPENTPYLPAEYDKDGFIHCTSGDELMIKVANRFYKNVAGDYVLFVIDTMKLKDPASPVKWEKASEFDSLFPHIYGPIDRKAIVEVRSVQRADDGTFVGWSISN